MRIGHGYDVHALVEGRDLILGGVKIPYEKGLLGHSDADVLLHAVSDALLGAAALVIAAWVILTKRASKAQKTAMWIELVVCVIAIVLLEFSLDGRLTFGNPTLLRDYSIMAAVCAVLFAHPCALLFQKARKCASPM